MLDDGAIQEIWKPIKYFEESYAISNLGHIKSLERRVRNQRKSNSTRLIPERILSQKTKSNGYKEVCLNSPNKQKMCYVHRLVCEAFIGEIKTGYNVNHKDGDKKNNKLENLEIVTYSRNCKHAYDTNLRLPSPPKYGQESHFSKVNEAEARKIKQLYEAGMNPRLIHARFKTLSLSGLRKICYGASWSHL